MFLTNLRTVSMPGFSVWPARIFQSVVNGTPETLASQRMRGISMLESSAFSSSVEGMFVRMPSAYRKRNALTSPIRNAVGVSVPPVEKIDSKVTLWANVKALMEARWGAANINRLAREAKIANATVQRMKAQETSVGIDVLESIAKLFGVQAWELIKPGIDPKRLSPIAAEVAGWIDTLTSEDARLKVWAINARMIQRGVWPSFPDEAARHGTPLPDSQPTAAPRYSR